MSIPTRVVTGVLEREREGEGEREEGGEGEGEEEREGELLFCPSSIRPTV